MLTPGRRGAPWLWAVVVFFGCSRGVTAEPSTAGEASSVEASKQASRAKAEQATESAVDREGLLIGEFRLPENPVIDGDTIRVEGIESSVRLLSLDSEERFHGKRERSAAEEDFEAYLKTRRARAKRPVKTGTPLGEEAAEFAEKFFAEVEIVRLERDDPKEIRGYFGRPLAYVFAKKSGRWTSYNVECVRAGMSPYFTKYGYSHRFHNQLSHAEAEAKEAQRGIWDPNAQGYGDYEERTAWWNARADFIRAFEHEANGREDLVLLSHSDAMTRLESRLGMETTVLSSITEIKRFERLTRVSLAVSAKTRFPIIFFDRDVFEASGIAAYAGEPVVVQGRVELYEKGRYRTLQIVVQDQKQLKLPDLPTVRHATSPASDR
jgi:endonuclease YncB( thermonuclease family)